MSLIIINIHLNESQISTVASNSEVEFNMQLDIILLMLIMTSVEHFINFTIKSYK